MATNEYQTSADAVLPGPQEAMPAVAVALFSVCPVRRAEPVQLAPGVMADADAQVLLPG